MGAINLRFNSYFVVVKNRNVYILQNPVYKEETSRLKLANKAKTFKESIRKVEKVKDERIKPKNGK